MSIEPKACKNTDTHLWRKVKDDFYSPSIHFTKSGCIGMDVGGHVIVMSVEKWHALGRLRMVLDELNQED
jgi:hypothetical protein